MRATPLMLAIALGLGLPALTADAAAPARQDVRKSEARPVWIVVFDEPAAASFRGFERDARRPKLAATSPVATGAAKYDARSDAARAYAGYLAELRELRLADASARLGRELVPDYVYTHATNGVALKLGEDEAALLRAMPGVERVARDFTRRTMTDESTQWIGADRIWNSVEPGVGSHRGENMVVGVIDTGIFRTHTAFAGTGISNPRGQYYGFCASNPSACNTKLIGLWDFTTDPDGFADPTDGNGHGTHVAGTAAGNPFLTYSGVAPRANIIAYKGCPTDQCNGAALIKAIDQAVSDAVDVINFSIGGESQDPWLDVASGGYYDESEAFLAARDAGIVVAAAAGNDGAAAGSLSYPSNSPWVLSVANAAHETNGPTAAYDDDLYRLAASSGRGPVVPFGVVKPDITAPGTNIASAGIDTPTGVAVKTGTSMATPHVAGAAALLKSTNPALNADQIISALMLTARPGVRITNFTVADPHDEGAGMLDVAKAARAGLYQAVPADAFRTARANVFDGAAEGLNLPSLADGGCFRTCTLTRTFTLMPGAAPATYNVQATIIGTGATIVPSVGSFTSSASGTAISVTINVDNPALVNRWIYGAVNLVNTSGDGRPNLHLPVAVYATPFADAPSEAALANVEHVAANERGYFDVEVSGLVSLPDARFVTSALVAPTRTIQDIAVDPTRNDPFDSPAGTYQRLVTVTPTQLTRYRIGAATSAANPDIDLFVGRDTNNDGQPQGGELLCMSATALSDEDCSVELDLNAPTTFWVVAQNWAGAGTAVTVDSYALPLVVADSPNLVVTGPGNVPGGTPFTIRVAYDDHTMTPGARRLGLLMIQTSPGNTIVTTPFTITRSGGGFAPFGLSPGTARTVTLPVAAAHDRLYVDIPPNATQATFRTQNGTGSVSLYAARTPIPAGPVIAAAPARNAPGVLVSSAAGADQTIIVSGANLQPGRWYLTPVNTGGGEAKVDVVATIDTVASVPALTRGSYYNPTRGGHGIFLYPSGPDHALLWYTYLQDGTPTWYYAQGTQPGASQVWTGAVYRAAWNGSSRTLEQIGTMVLTPSSATGLTMSYNIDGFTGSETMDTFLTGCPMHAGSPLDVSAHWYDTVSPGYGYSVQVHPEYEFLATFVYDGIGVPRFLAAERGGAFAGGNTTLPLDQLAGFAPLGTHSAPVRTTVGQLTRAYGVSTIETIGTNAAFANGVPGTWTRSATVTRLSDQPQGCN